ncbi:MAG: type II secretion system protein [Oceanospirillales bacterium]|nr:type II secretion system protein [Oceanospirillales bacterium]
MRKTAGFTLIELVIVIVILGILGAVAAPRLFNLQGDAYGANLNALKSSISTSMTMANAKAQIQGKFVVSGEDDANSITGYEGIQFVAGYPAALTNADTNKPPAGILATLEELDSARYTMGAADGVLTITPVAATNPATCAVTYKEATAADTSINPATPAEPAKVVAVTTGC